MARTTSAVGVALVLALSAGGSAQPPAKAPAADWKDLFDGKTLAGWKVADFGDGGTAAVRDGAIVMDKANGMSGVTYSRADFPKLDYEVSLEGKRVDGRDFFCTTTFPVGDAFCSFVVGGWGGTIVGLSSVNFEDASQNLTTSVKEFESARWYKVRVRVTKDRIRAWIDDDQVVDLDTADKKLTIRRECEPNRPFGFATWKTTGAVRQVRVRTLAANER